jgi:hypothetical protein
MRRGRLDTVMKKTHLEKPPLNAGHQFKSNTQYFT